MHIFAMPISVMVTTAGNGARFCATSAPKIGPRKCFILTLRWLSVVRGEMIAYNWSQRIRTNYNEAADFQRLFLVRPARTYSKGCKSLNRPDSGKVTARGKGVRRETESEGSRRQTSGLTDRNPIWGLWVRIRLQKKSKSDNYPKSPKVKEEERKRRKRGMRM